MGESKRRKDSDNYPVQTEKPIRKRMTQTEILKMIGRSSFNMAATLSVADTVKAQADLLMDQ
ncbi:hypothetical protein D3C74_406020 [compost metagenome]